MRPSILILHYTGVASAAKAIDWLSRPDSRVSCHYVIDETGRITQMVAEEARAWHAGEASWAGETDINSASIGVEMQNPGHELGYPDFPEPQLVRRRSVGTGHPHPASASGPSACWPTPMWRPSARSIRRKVSLGAACRRGCRPLGRAGSARRRRTRHRRRRRRPPVCRAADASCAAMATRSSRPGSSTVPPSWSSRRSSATSVPPGSTAASTPRPSPRSSASLPRCPPGRESRLASEARSRPAAVRICLRPTSQKRAETSQN